VDFQDFGFFRMAITEIYFVGGFGSMGWVMPAEYVQAAVDPLADESSNLIRELNSEHAKTLLLLARALGDADAQQATVTALDRLGLHIRFTTPGRMQGGRVAFTGPVHHASEVRTGLAGLAAQAKAGVPVLHSL
jgi:heme iron utilization protein